MSCDCFFVLVHLLSHQKRGGQDCGLYLPLAFPPGSRLGPLPSRPPLWRVMASRYHRCCVSWVNISWVGWWEAAAPALDTGTLCCLSGCIPHTGAQSDLSCSPRGAFASQQNCSSHNTDTVNWRHALREGLMETTVELTIWRVFFGVFFQNVSVFCDSKQTCVCHGSA